MKLIISWTLKIISISLLIVPLLLCVPGLIFHVISTELDERWDDEKVDNDDQKMVK
jgi:hypothetical protein